MPSSTREFLKEGTLENHKQIEEQLNFQRPDITLSDYTKILKKYLGFYEVIEQKIGQFKTLPPELEWESRQKVSLLKKDLAALGETNFSVPQCQQIPALNSMTEVLASLYVLEGSTLGGRFLLKFFSDKLSLTPETGAAFFNSYGASTGEMWKKFIALLEAEVTGPENQLQALKTAKTIFSELGAWMDFKLKFAP